MAQNDPVGQQIFREYHNTPMPNFNLDDREVDDVLAYIAQQGGA